MSSEKGLRKTRFKALEIENTDENLSMSESLNLIIKAIILMYSLPFFAKTLS
jgi:hypothetical protein